MNSSRKTTINTAVITTFILATLVLAGCGDNELVKGITDVVKKSVGTEVAKKGEDIKKQFDQIINLATGKDQKEGGPGDAKVGKAKSEKDSGDASDEDKD
jgi:hypothetical protein